MKRGEDPRQMTMLSRKTLLSFVGGDATKLHKTTLTSQFWRKFGDNSMRNIV